MRINYKVDEDTGNFHVYNETTYLGTLRRLNNLWEFVSKIDQYRFNFILKTELKDAKILLLEIFDDMKEFNTYLC